MTVWQRDERVLWRRAQAGIVFLPPDGDKFLILTGPAALIWELVEHPTEQASLIAALDDSFRDAAGRVAQDVDRFLTELASVGALVHS